MLNRPLNWDTQRLRKPFSLLTDASTSTSADIQGIWYSQSALPCAQNGTTSEASGNTPSNSRTTCLPSLSCDNEHYELSSVVTGHDQAATARTKH